MLLKVLLLFAIIHFTSYAEGNWIVDNSYIYTNGDTVHGHKFGIIKGEGDRCNDHLLLLTWSTHNSNLEKFEGQHTKILILLDNHTTHTTVELITTYNFSGVLTLAIFGNIAISEELLDIIGESKKLTLTFPDSNEISTALDIKQDTFNIKGFTEALNQATNLCTTN